MTAATTWWPANNPLPSHLSVTLSEQAQLQHAKSSVTFNCLRIWTSPPVDEAERTTVRRSGPYIGKKRRAKVHSFIQSRSQGRRQEQEKATRSPRQDHRVRPLVQITNNLSEKK